MAKESLSNEKQSWMDSDWITNRGSWIMGEQLLGLPSNGGKHGDLVLLTNIYHLINLMILQYHDFTDPLSLINVPLSDSPRLWFSIVCDGYLYTWINLHYCF